MFTVPQDRPIRIPFCGGSGTESSQNGAGYKQVISPEPYLPRRGLHPATRTLIGHFRRHDGRKIPTKCQMPALTSILPQSRYPRGYTGPPAAEDRFL